MRGLCPSRWWPGGRVPRGRDGGHLCEEGQVVQSGAATNRELLGPSQHRAKPWELSVDKVQRDVGDATCGPTHTEQGPFTEGRVESDELGLGSWLPLDDAAREKQREANGSTCMPCWAAGGPQACPVLTTEAAQTRGCYVCETGE